MYNGPPPEGVRHWPSYRLLRFAMEVGLGLPADSPSGGSWQPRYLIHALGQVIAIGNKIDDSLRRWRNGEDVPGDDNRRGLVRVMCDPEPAEHRDAWRQLFYRAWDEDKRRGRLARQTDYEAWVSRGCSLAPDNLTSAFSDFVARLQPNDTALRASYDKQLRSDQDALYRRIDNSVPETIRTIQRAKAAAIRQDFAAADALLGEHQAGLGAAAEEALRVFEALAGILLARADNALERARNEADAGVDPLPRYREAIAHYRQALDGTPPSALDVGRSCRRGIRLALYEAVREAGFDDGLALMRDSLGWGITRTTSAWNQLLMASPDAGTMLGLLEVRTSIYAPEMDLSIACRPA